MKKAMILMVVLLFAGSMAFAADGDLIVNGKVVVGTPTVGTPPTQTKIDVNGDISFVKDGKRFVLQYMNLGEDVYSSGPGTTETCGPGDIYNQYTCGPSENRVCDDSYWTCTDDGYCQMPVRRVTCKAVLVFVAQ